MHVLESYKMLKMSSFGADARTETFAPLVNCVIDDALLQSLTDIDQTLPMFIFRLVDPLLHYFPHFVVNWVQIWTVGSQTSAGASRFRTLSVSRARWAGALSRWTGRREVECKEGHFGWSTELSLYATFKLPGWPHIVHREPSRHCSGQVGLLQFRILSNYYSNQLEYG